jgi:hypothetical protein
VRLRRRAALLSLLAVAALLPARPLPAPAQTADDRAAIQALLDTRARAVVERDRAAFMSTVSGLIPEFRRQQGRVFRWMSEVPFASYELRANWSTWGDIATGPERAAYPAAEAVTIPLTEERYRIRGIDNAPASEDLYFTFAKHDGQWQITSDSAVAYLGFMSTTHLWDLGPVDVVHDGKFRIFRHPCRDQRTCAQLPDGVGSVLDSGLERARPYWSGPWPQRVGVVVPDTKAELHKVLHASFDLTDFVAFTYSSFDHDRYSGPRIVLNWRALQGRSSDAVARVVAHELMHVATRSSAGPFVPIFVDEGYADHAANAGSSSSLTYFDYQRSVGGVDGSLPRDYEFTTGTGSSIFLNYQTAQSAMDFFVRTWGQHAFERFYKELGSKREVPGTTEYHVSRAMKQTIGIGLDAFERAWAGSLGL